MTYPATWRRAGEFDCTRELPRDAVRKSTHIVDARASISNACKDFALLEGWRGRVGGLLVRCAQKLIEDEMRVYSRGLEQQKTQGKTQMRSLFKFTVALFLFLLLPVVALAQAAASLPVELTTDQAFAELAKVIGGMHGASALGIAVAVTQIIMLIFRSPIGNLTGKWKLLIVTVISLVSTYLGLIASGAPWGVSLIAGPIVAGVQVLVHQAIVLFKPGASPPSA